MTYKIRGIANETYKINKTVHPSEYGLGEKSIEKLVESGKEPVLYLMDRVIDGTRKKPETIFAWRFAQTNIFIPIIWKWKKSKHTRGFIMKDNEFVQNAREICKNNSFEDAFKAVRAIKNVPHHVATDFYNTYGKGGALTAEQSFKVFYDECNEK